jgi:hypothetical protein
MNEITETSLFILPKLKTVKELEETEEWIRKTVKSLV